MNTHADKTQEHKSQSVAAKSAQKQGSGEPTLGFIDNRPEAVQMRKLQKMANNSPQAAYTAQMKLSVNNKSTQFKVNDLRKVVAKNDSSTVIQGLFLPEANKEIAEDQMTLKAEWFMASDENRKQDKALIGNMQTATAIRPEAIMVVGKSTPLFKVSASSAHHDLNLIAAKAPSAASKEYGFSFVDKKVEAADIKLINAHIEHVNATGDPTLLNWGDVVHGPATHRSARDGMIQYTVNNRTYSTHAESTQLFPVVGDGIISGLGPTEMMTALNQIGKLNVKIFYQLTGGNKPWAQVGKEEKNKIESDYKDYINK